MNPSMLLQVSESVILKSAEMAEKDPHGMIITLVSVSVVFLALIILYFAYTLIGRTVNRTIDWKGLICRKTQTAGNDTPSPEETAAIALALDQKLNGETYAAIGVALHRYLNDTVHDNESYIITIKRKKS